MSIFNHTLLLVLSIYKKLHAILNLGNLYIVFKRILIIQLGLTVWILAAEPLKNLAVLDSSVTNELNLIFDDIMFDSAGVKIEFGTVMGEKRGYLNALIIGYLNRKDIAVNRSVAPLTLMIEHFDPNFVYKQEKGNLLGLSDNYQRQLNLKITGWLEKTGGEVIRYFNADKSSTDQIRESYFAELERGPYRFQKGEIIQTTLWGKAIEPVLIIMSVSAVVYLFFTMRT